MGTCACIYVDPSYDQPKFCKQAIRRARRPHQCCECDKTIEAGEEYEHTSGKWDQHIDSYATCLDCQNIRDRMFCAGWFYGQLWEDLHEHLFALGGHVDGACLAALRPGARAAVCVMIEKIWNDEKEEEE